jgi:hypothetical protein
MNNDIAKWKKTLKCLYKVGIAFLFIAFLFITKNNVMVGFIFIICGLVLMIPDYYLFCKETKMAATYRLWFGFFCLVFLAVICIIFFIRFILHRSVN